MCVKNHRPRRFSSSNGLGASYMTPVCAAFSFFRHSREGGNPLLHHQRNQFPKQQHCHSGESRSPVFNSPLSRGVAPISPPLRRIGDGVCFPTTSPHVPGPPRRVLARHDHDLLSSEFNTIVTGPQLHSSTAIFAPKIPDSTFTPRAFTWSLK